MSPLDRAIARLAADRKRGSAQLAREAASILVRAAAAGLSAPELRSIAQTIAAAQPSMAAVTNTAAVFAEGIATPDESARRLATYWEEAPSALANRHAGQLRGIVLTHSWSSDVMRTLETARPALVVITEARPGSEGVAAGERLRAAGIDVRLVADAAAGHFVRGVECVVLGADTILPDGSIVNKVGSYPIAAAANDAGKPVYILAETMKVSAVTEPVLGDASKAFSGSRVESPLFEVVPGHLIATVLTEDGELDRATLDELADRFRRARATL